MIEGMVAALWAPCEVHDGTWLRYVDAISLVKFVRFTAFDWRRQLTRELPTLQD